MTKHTPEFIQPQLNFDSEHYEFVVLHPNANVLTGKQFGRLTVLGPIDRDKHRHIVWLCRCECDKTIKVPSVHLTTKGTVSCGCARIDRVGALNMTHGLSHHPLFSTWQGMMRRCNYPDPRNRHLYKGRGISVCDEWSNNPQAFFDHASQLLHCGEKGYTLDRIDNNGNYEPGNVRWATPIEQSRNTRTNRMITYKGETKCLTEWAHDYRIDTGTLTGRLRRGWPIEKALTLKPRHKT